MKQKKNLPGRSLTEFEKHGLANLFTAILLMLSMHENIFGLESFGAGTSKASRCRFFLLCSVVLELCKNLTLGFYTLNA